MAGGSSPDSEPRHNQRCAAREQDEGLPAWPATGCSAPCLGGSGCSVQRGRSLHGLPTGLMGGKRIRRGRVSLPGHGWRSRRGNDTRTRPRIQAPRSRPGAGGQSLDEALPWWVEGFAGGLECPSRGPGPCLCRLVGQPCKGRRAVRQDAASKGIGCGDRRNNSSGRFRGTGRRGLGFCRGRLRPVAAESIRTRSVTQSGW